VRTDPRLPGNAEPDWRDLHQPRAERLAGRRLRGAAHRLPGLGTPGRHSFLVGKAEGRGVLDIVQAARELDPRIGKRYLIAGHQVIYKSYPGIGHGGVVTAGEPDALAFSGRRWRPGADAASLNCRASR
jgi:hypothetical protein